MSMENTLWVIFLRVDSLCENAYLTSGEVPGGRLSVRVWADHVRDRLGQLVVLCGLARLLFGVWEQEPNDDFDQANYVAYGDTIYCATLHPQGDQDYFQFVGQAGDTVVAFTFDCDGSNTNTFLCLYSSSHELLALNDDGGGAGFSLIEHVLPFHGTYFLRALEVEPSFDSSYSLVLNCVEWTVPTHDSCANARVVEGIPYQDASSTADCGDECGTAAPDVWYFFSNPAQRTVIFSVCQTAFDARVQIMGGCCEQFGDDSEDGCGDGAILIVPDLEVGDYYILVEGTGATEAGNFVFQVNGETEPCPEPTELALGTVGGYPFLFWEAVAGADLYIIWHSTDAIGEYEHIGTTAETFWTDSTGYSGTRRFYRVTAYCPW
jgi:hypothetical protein